MYGYLKVAVFLILTSILLLGLACRTTTPPQSIPTPIAIPATELYDYFLREKEQNPTRLKDRVERNQIRRLTIVISKIEGRRIQQHFGKLAFDTDPYIECEFEDERRVLPLNVGQSIDVYGTLYEAFDGRFLRPDSKAVKFRDCHY